MANKLYITDTILRDGHQSKAATRMPLSDMLPACEALDNIGYWSLEVWGGATFDACLRYLNEDPWERLRQLRKALPKTKLQMLFRGQNILGYKNYRHRHHPHLRRPERHPEPGSRHQVHQEVRRLVRARPELHHLPGPL